MSFVCSLLTIFYKLLLLNQWTDFKITSQECFFDSPLLKLFKDFIPSRTLIAAASEKGKIAKTLKIFLFKSTGPI